MIPNESLPNASHANKQCELENSPPIDQSNGRLVFATGSRWTLACKGTTSQVFNSVQFIRRADPNQADCFKFDRHSTHYCIYEGPRPIGAVTVTRLIDGDIDCSDCYPRKLLFHYGPVLFSSCKFRILRTEHSGFQVLREFVRVIWRDQMANGARLDVINCERKLVPFYRRIGYVEIPGATFIHPTLGTDSVAMLMSADPSRRSFCREDFEQVDRPLALTDVLSVL